MDAWKEKDKIIWGNVERIRKDKKLSRAKLAELAKTSPTALNLIDKKKRGIGGILLKRIADALEVSESSLMSEKRDAGTSPANDNVIVLSRRKYLEFFSLVDKVIESDKADQHITAMTAYIRGVMMIEDRQSGELRAMRELLEEIRDVLAGEAIRPKKKVK